MAKSRIAKNSAALAVGESVLEHAAPATGGDAVHIVGIDAGVTITVSIPSVGQAGQPVPAFVDMAGANNPNGDATYLITDADGNLLTAAPGLATCASFTSGALAANTSTALAAHTAARQVRVSNPSTASNTLWVALNGTAAIGTGTEIPVGTTDVFYVANSSQINVITAGTQAVGFTVE